MRGGNKTSSSGAPGNRHTTASVTVLCGSHWCLGSHVGKTKPREGEMFCVWPGRNWRRRNSSSSLCGPQLCSGPSSQLSFPPCSPNLLTPPPRLLVLCPHPEPPPQVSASLTQRRIRKTNLLMPLLKIKSQQLLALPRQHPTSGPLGCSLGVTGMQISL